MTTDLMEAWSLEIGDQILISGNIFKIIDIEDTDCDYLFDVVDEDGFVRQILAEGSKKFRLVLDNLATID